MWWFIGVALAADPSVNVAWKGDEARLFVRAPEGEHVAPEAPFDLELRVGDRSLTVAAMGVDVQRGVPVGDVRGATLDGSMKVSLCEDGGTRCRLVEVGLKGSVDLVRRGTVTLLVGPLDGPEGNAFPAKVDAGRVYERASALARTQRKPMLLDFGAIWCPPCSLLDVEVFSADPRPAVVDAFVLAQLDVDDPSSWTLKDRYDVGGYPTLIAVDAEGAEIGRLVGYPGLGDTVEWLDAVATGRYLRRAGDPSPTQAAQLAWQAVQEGKDDEARSLLALAEPQPDLVAFRLARMNLDPNLEDARWLSKRAPGFAADWVGSVGEVTATEEGRIVVRDAIQQDLANANPLDGADLLWFAADLADSPSEARTLYAAAAALVRSQLVGDPRQDKGHYNWLAMLSDRAGQPTEALSLLEAARDAFPDEPTFHLDLARMHVHQGHGEEALAAAEAALDVAWGDNALMAAIEKTEALLLLGRKDDAKAYVAEVLTTWPEPAGELGVRTHRYRKKLADMVDGAR